MMFGSDAERAASQPGEVTRQGGSREDGVQVGSEGGAVMSSAVAFQVAKTTPSYHLRSHSAHDQMRFQASIPKK